MKTPKALVAAALAVSALVAGAAIAQQPIIGGTLYSDLPGPVTMTFLNSAMPSSINWYLPMYWKTGAAALDYASTGGQVPTSCSATGCMVSPPNAAGQFSRSSPPGATLTSPVLAGGTQMFFAAGLYSNYPQPRPDNPRQLELVHTGGTPTQLPFYFQKEPMDRPLLGQPMRQAAIFTTGDGTARIGFTSSAGSPFSLSFLDYPIQILVGNVCVK